MNLHGIVRGAITTVNPDVIATLRRSTGYSIDPDGTQVPAYEDLPIVAQVQALSFKDLTQLNGLNISGAGRAVYLSGAAFGVIRNIQAGGDLIVFPSGITPEGDTWLVVHVLEQWGPGAEWCKCAITLQNG